MTEVRFKFKKKNDKVFCEAESAKGDFVVEGTLEDYPTPEKIFQKAYEMLQNEHGKEAFPDPEQVGKIPDWSNFEELVRN